MHANSCIQLARSQAVNRTCDAKVKVLTYAPQHALDHYLKRSLPEAFALVFAQIASTVMLTFILVAGYFVQNIHAWVAWLKCVSTSSCPPNCSLGWP